jgi:hypothetical protein
MSITELDISNVNICEKIPDSVRILDCHNNKAIKFEDIIELPLEQLNMANSGILTGSDKTKKLPSGLKILKCSDNITYEDIRNLPLETLDLRTVNEN